MAYFNLVATHQCETNFSRREISAGANKGIQSWSDDSQLSAPKKTMQLCRKWGQDDAHSHSPQSKQHFIDFNGAHLRTVQYIC